jgi:molybdopterin synthase sulfur carrier subunit
MPPLKILAFAHARSAVGFAEQTVEVLPTDTPRMILMGLLGDQSASVCGTCRVAIDLEYRAWDEPIGNAQEMAIIPPVSGG